MARGLRCTAARRSIEARSQSGFLRFLARLERRSCILGSARFSQKLRRAFPARRFRFGLRRRIRPGQRLGRNRQDILRNLFHALCRQRPRPGYGLAHRILRAAAQGRARTRRDLSDALVEAATRSGFGRSRQLPALLARRAAGGTGRGRQARALCHARRDRGGRARPLRSGSGLGRRSGGGVLSPDPGLGTGGIGRRRHDAFGL